MNEAVWSTLAMPALQGTNRIYVHDQQLFRKGQVIITHELFVAQIIDFGSLVLDRNLDQTFPAGAIVRAITPQEIDDPYNRHKEFQLSIRNSPIRTVIGRESSPIYQKKTQANRYRNFTLESLVAKRDE